MNLKKLLRAAVCFQSPPEAYLGKRASSFLVNATIASRDSSPGDPGPNASSPRWLRSRLSAETQDTHTDPAHALASPHFPAGRLASSGICIQQSSREKQQKPFSKKKTEREAHGRQCLIVNRGNSVQTHGCALFFRAATQESVASPQINFEFLDLILLK